MPHQLYTVSLNVTVFTISAILDSVKATTVCTQTVPLLDQNCYYYYVFFQQRNVADGFDKNFKNYGSKGTS